MYSCILELILIVSWARSTSSGRNFASYKSRISLFYASPLAYITFKFLMVGWLWYRISKTQVFSCFGQYFCLHFEAFQLGMAPVYIAFLRFMGDDNDAKNYSYSLEVGGNGRKMVWQGVPRSIRDSHRKVRDSFDGLIIQRNMALFFSGGDRKELKLRVTGRIWKEQWYWEKLLNRNATTSNPILLARSLVAFL